jgi:uncharacterized protein (UPF0332 family)
MDDPTEEDAQQEVARAREAFHDAEVLVAAGGSTAGTLNRLYYAVFHAAQAVLYAHGENPSSHGHVRQQFGQHIVLNGEASRAEGRLLGTLYDHRQNADYGGDVSDIEVEPLLEEVGDFITHMAALVESN